ncbi:MAG: hypothetical protein HC822_00680 [Oscillochloris sp.]|nr:hypothetical protein [Oscillochloris sp.]
MLILADAGLTCPPIQAVDDRFQIVSFEPSHDMDGDVIFVGAYGKNRETITEWIVLVR